MKYILYHGGCPDGYGSAFAFWKQLGGSAIYLGVRHGTPYRTFISLLSRSDTVFVVDFCFDLPTTAKLIDQVGGVVILDHHVSNQPVIEWAQQNGAPRSIYDVDRSGAMISWQYANPDVPPPLLIQYIQDRDLWRFNLPDTKDFCEGLWAVGYDPYYWDQIVHEPRLYTLCCMTGTILRANKDKIVERLVRTVHYIDVLKFRHVPAVNCQVYHSEVGAALLERYKDAPFVAIYSDQGDRQRWSFRAHEGVDISGLAEQLGGGGHAAAAGCHIPLEIAPTHNLQLYYESRIRGLFE